MPSYPTIAAKDVRRSLNSIQFSVRRTIRFQGDCIKHNIALIHFSPVIASLCFDPLRAALPEEDPRITNGRPRYQIGDTVQVNCTAGRSKPATHLNWFVNGEPAEPQLLRQYEPVVTGREGLETSTLGLEFRVKAKHFRKGDMKLKVSGLNDDVALRVLRDAYSRFEYMFA